MQIEQSKISGRRNKVSKNEQNKMKIFLDQFQMQNFSQIYQDDKESNNKGIELQFNNDVLLQFNQNLNPSNSNNKCRVSQKLKMNKLRKFQLELQKEKEKIKIMNRRRERFQELNNFLQQRNLLSDLNKQLNIHHHDETLEKQKKQKDNISPYKQFEINQKINKGRAKANHLTTNYAFRIQQKNKDRLQKVKMNKTYFDSLQAEKVQKVHMKQWNNFKLKLKQKSPERSNNPPDYLYQKYQQKENSLKHLLSIKQKMNKNITQEKPIIQKPVQQFTNLRNKVKQQAKKYNCQSLPHLMIPKRSQTNPQQKLTQVNYVQKVFPIQYFGIYNEQVTAYKTSKNSHKDKNFQTIKRFIQYQWSGKLKDQLYTNEEFLNEFQDFLAQQNLHQMSKVRSKGGAIPAKNK